jgi:hypothetical protein
MLQKNRSVGNITRVLDFLKYVKIRDETQNIHVYF